MGGGLSKMAQRELLATIRNRYRSSFKKDKSRIIDEFIAATGHDHQPGIGLLARPQPPARILVTLAPYVSTDGANRMVSPPRAV